MAAAILRRLPLARATPFGWTLDRLPDFDRARILLTARTVDVDRMNAVRAAARRASKRTGLNGSILGTVAYARFEDGGDAVGFLDRLRLAGTPIAPWLSRILSGGADHMSDATQEWVADVAWANFVHGATPPNARPRKVGPGDFAAVDPDPWAMPAESLK